jgi:large subunit ribosomal protein L21
LANAKAGKLNDIFAGKGTMFAVVRTGGKQYRVAAGDKIAVEKLAGEAGDTITLGDVLLAGEDGAIADASKVSVSAEIIAQAKSEKVIVFKKRRRHNYRRKAGHRQQMTLLRIVSVGEAKKAAPKKAAAEKAEAPAGDSAE